MEAQPHDVVSDMKEQTLIAPPGWTKKLVPTKEKGVTLKKHDTVFVAPDGQELKSKWHLTRYLKAHPGGPSVSDFDWSSGEEIPVRRSGRVSTTEIRVIEKPTPRKRGKRNVSEMEGKETAGDEAKTSPRKRIKQANEADKDAAEDSKGPSAVDEVMQEDVQDGSKGPSAVDEVMQEDVQDGSKGHGMDAMEGKETAGEEAITSPRKHTEQAKDAAEASTGPSAVDEAMREEDVQDGSKGHGTDAMEAQVVAKEDGEKPVEAVGSMEAATEEFVLGEERGDASPKVTQEVETEHVITEALSGDGQLEIESKDDDKMVVEPEAPEDQEGKPEQLLDEAHEVCKDDDASNKEAMEMCAAEEVWMGGEKTSEPSIPKEEQQKHVISHTEGVDKPLEPSNPKEELDEAPPGQEKTSEEIIQSHVPVGAGNQ